MDRKASNPNTCEGASIESALRYVFEKGLCLEKDYNPYSGTREKCHRVSCPRVNSLLRMIIFSILLRITVVYFLPSQLF